MASEWFYQVMGQQVGPVSALELRNLAQQGIISRNTPVRKGPDGAWFSAEACAGIAYAAKQTGRSYRECQRPKHRHLAILPKMSPRGWNASQRSYWASAAVILLSMLALFVWSIATRDTWELDNALRISARLEAADRLQRSDALAAYRAYDEVLKEAKLHKIASAGNW